MPEDTSTLTPTPGLAGNPNPPEEGGSEETGSEGTPPEPDESADDSGDE